MLPFHAAVQSDFDAVNQLIVRELHSDVELVESIGHYIIDAGGKRLRPYTVLLVSMALGYAEKKHQDLAAIIEFIHTATLLHDDVVDVSSLRRGRSTANANWGNAPSVLVGDFLYSRAFQMMVGIGDMEIMAILSYTTNAISEGEVQQLVNAKNPEVTEVNYLSVIHKKTAALFEAAAETAAVLAGAHSKLRATAKQLGYHLGMAFQLIDDALDYTGNVEALGKNIGDDLAEGKPTLPLIYAINHCETEEAALLKKAITLGSLNRLNQVINIVQTCGGIEYTNSLAREHSEKASVLIEQFPENHFRSALSDLVLFSVERTY